MSLNDDPPWTTLPMDPQKIIEQPSECLLLTLPAELRERIYRYALKGQMPDYCVFVRTGYLYSRPAAPLIAPLLATCRQIKHEGVPIFFQDNIFCFRIGKRKYSESSIDFSACKMYAPYIPHMRHIRILVDQLSFLLELEKGLETYRFESTTPDWVLLRDRSMFQYTVKERSTAEELVASIATKGRSILDAMAKGAVLCGEAPVMSIRGLYEVMEMISVENEALYS